MTARELERESGLLDDPEIQQVFLEESDELLERFRVVAVRAPELSVEDGDRLFVVFHSFKGNLTVVGLTIYAEAARAMEKLTGLFSRDGQELPDEVVGLALEAFADLDRLIAAIRGGVHAEALPQPGDWTLRAHDLAASIEREREAVRLADAPTPVVTLPRPSLPPSRRPAPGESHGQDRAAAGVFCPGRVESSASGDGAWRGNGTRPDSASSASKSTGSGSDSSSSMALRRIDAAVWICRFRIVEDCPLVQSTLSLATQRLLEVGELLSLEKSGDHGLHVKASVRSDAEAGALARALVMSWIDEVMLERDTALVPQDDLSSAGPALVRREALLREIMTELGDGIRASEQVLRALCRGELEPAALAKAEIALSELGIAAGALGFSGLGALALELGVSLGGARPAQVPGSGLLESTNDALALILDWQEILDDPEAGFALARALRAARGAPPVVRLEGAWLADLPDSQSRLEPVRLTQPWERISGGLGLLADIRAAGARGSAGRGRLRAAGSAGMTSRELRAMFWISSSRSAGEPAPVDELGSATPDAGTAPPSAQQWFVPYDDLDRLAVAMATVDEEARRALAPALESLRSAPLRDLADHLQVCAHGFRHGRRTLQLELNFHDDGRSIDRRILELSREPLTECLLTVLRSELTRGEDDGVAEISVRLGSDGETLTARFDYTDDRSAGSPSGPAIDAVAEFVESYAGRLSHSRDGRRSVLEVALSVGMTAVRVRCVKVAGKRLAIVPAHLEIGVVEGDVVLCGDGRVPLRDWPTELCGTSPGQARAAVIVGDGESGAALPIDNVGEVLLATVRGREAELERGVTCPLVDLPSLVAHGRIASGEVTL